MKSKNKVQLITYPDSMGGNLRALDRVLEEHFPGVFKGGLHILPPFPSSGDRGFAPLTYFDIDPAHGTWSDVQRLAEQYDILLDLMVNHISQKSSYFQDFLQSGDASPYASFFLSTTQLWEDGNPVQADIDKMFLRREQPYSEFCIRSTGETKRLWTTFGRSTPSEQIDFDVQEPKVREFFTGILSFFAKNGITIVRLDAVGYIVKKLGTTCFFVEPDIYEFMDWIKAEADRLGLTLLPEVHAPLEIQYSLSKHGFWIYDFVLPYVVLDTLINRDATLLYRYLPNRPERQFTMLDCHDGVPVKPDLDGILDSASIRQVTDLCAERGASFSRVVSEKHKGEDGFDVHQIRGTYYSLLNRDDDAYIAARAIQMFVPGIPQVYYVGLLAGENDEDAVRITGEAREINRHNFTEQEVADCAKKSVVQRLVRLIRLRNTHPAFDGEFHFVSDAPEQVQLEWRNQEFYCRLLIDLSTMTSTVVYSEDGKESPVIL